MVAVQLPSESSKKIEPRRHASWVWNGSNSNPIGTLPQLCNPTGPTAASGFPVLQFHSFFGARTKGKKRTHNSMPFERNPIPTRTHHKRYQSTKPQAGMCKGAKTSHFNRNDAWHRRKGVRKPLQQPTDRPDISSDFPHLRSRPICPNGQQIPAAWLPEWSPHSGSPASAASHCRHQPGAPRPGAIGR